MSSTAVLEMQVPSTSSSKSYTVKRYADRYCQSLARALIAHRMSPETALRHIEKFVRGTSE